MRILCRNESGHWEGRFKKTRINSLVSVFMVLSWKKKGSTHHSPGKQILGRAACSILAIPVGVLQEEIYPAWEERALFRLQCYSWERLQRRNLLQPWVGAGGVLRLDFSRLWLNRWEAAMLHLRLWVWSAVPAFGVQLRTAWGHWAPWEGSEGGPEGSRVCWRGLSGSVCFFCLRVYGWVFPPGLPCREAGGRTSRKFQEAESRPWAWQSCGEPGRCSSVSSP